MAETGRTDSVFWPVGSGRTADLGKEAGKQAAEQLLCRAQKEMLQERERNQKELKQTTAAVSCSTMES